MKISRILMKRFITIGGTVDNSAEGASIACRQIIKNTNSLIDKYGEEDATEESCQDFLNELEVIEATLFENTQKGNVFEYWEVSPLDRELTYLKGLLQYYIDNGEPLFKNLEDVKNFYGVPAVTAECETVMAKYGKYSWAKARK